ncbi:COG3014 family protein [Elusimicrobiota bacterium]
MHKNFGKTISIVLFAVVLVTACAVKTVYYEDLNNLISGERYNEAVNLAQATRDKSYGKKNSLLYYLDTGLLFQLSGQYSKSNEAFEKAKKLAEKYFTKSVTTEASTYLISDNMRPYYGEDFERALINVFSAVNYIMLGKGDEALVEARQADHFLKTLQTNYGHKNVYKEDAFARYIMGMVYEDQGEINDAFISYRLALKAYKNYQKNYKVPVPKTLVNDALRTASLLGFKDEIQSIKQEWPNAVLKKFSKDQGELIVLNYNGFPAEKIDSFFEISFGKAWTYVDQSDVRGGSEAEKVEKASAIARSIVYDEQIRMAFPKYVRIPYRARNFKLIHDNPNIKPVRGEVAEDISAIAVQNLKRRIARIKIKTIVRAAIKHSLAKNVSEKVKKDSGSKFMGWLAKAAVKTASAATEHADKRSWRSLPDKIIVARMPLQKGAHSVKLRYFDKNNLVVREKTLNNVNIKAGKKTFVIVRTAI